MTKRRFGTPYRKPCRSWGYVPLQAGTVLEAIELFGQEEPGVTLLDIDLPDGSGLDVLENMKSQRDDVVAIMITGNVSVPNVLTALAEVPTTLSENRSGSKNSASLCEMHWKFASFVVKFNRSGESVRGSSALSRFWASLNR